LLARHDVSKLKIFLSQNANEKCKINLMMDLFLYTHTRMWQLGAYLEDLKGAIAPIKNSSFFDLIRNKKWKKKFF
jgi:hypothetical protein